jgi:hypothetical protein
MFWASLCPSSGEQEQDWLKLHLKMQSNNSFEKAHTAYTNGSTQPQPAQPGIFT